MPPKDSLKRVDLAPSSTQFNMVFLHDCHVLVGLQQQLTPVLLIHLEGTAPAPS